MKKTVAVAVVMMLILSGMAFAFQNEPEGFKGLKWGDPPTEELEFVSEMDEMMDVYQDRSENNKLGDARFYMMLYTFYVPPETTDRRFTEVILYFNGKVNFDVLETICKAKFGEPTDTGYRKFSWQSLVTTVLLNYDGVEKKGYLSITDALIFDEYTKEKKKQQVEKAESDW